MPNISRHWKRLEKRMDEMEGKEMGRNRRNNGTAILTGILAAMVAGFVLFAYGDFFWAIIAFFIVAFAAEELA